MSECGYERAKLDKEPSKLAVWTLGLRELPEMLRCLFVYTKLSRLMRDWHKFDGDEARALFHRVNPGSWARYPGFDLPSPPPLIGEAPSLPELPARKESEPAGPAGG